MTIKTLSSLALATLAVALCTATEAKATAGCAASKAFSGFTNLTTPAEGTPTSGLEFSPDAQAMAKAVGGLGLGASLVAGGTLLYRRRRFATPLAAVAEPETDLAFTLLPESVLVQEDLHAEASTASETESAASPVLSR